MHIKCTYNAWENNIKLFINLFVLLLGGDSSQLVGEKQSLMTSHINQKIIQANLRKLKV